MKLNEILTPPSDSNKDGEAYLEKATNLLRNYCIRKTSGSNTYYYHINEIEYYYHSKYNQDTSVHPHFFKDAGRFRIHFSGVDITFAADWKDKEVEARESLKRGKYIRSDKNPTLDFKQLENLIHSNDISYGGLLLREIVPFKVNEEFIHENNTPIVGPLGIINELFYLDGLDLSLTLESCPSRKNFDVGVRERKNLGKNARESSNNLNNYYVKPI